MAEFAQDRRSPYGGSVREFVARPKRRALDLVALRTDPAPSTSLGDYESLLAETLFAIGRAMVPSLEEVCTVARRHGVTGAPAELLRDARLPALLVDRFAVAAPGLAACRQHYDENADSFRMPTLYEGREILFGGDIADRVWRVEAYSRAERVIAMLLYNPRVFQDLVVYSAAASRARGGRIGPVARGAWDSEAAGAFFSLKDGEIFPLPVPSARGFHVLLMDRIQAGRLPPFAEMHAVVAARLVARAREVAAERHLAELAATLG
jgi:peptidyl-prolyl cis-trans isomerase C